MGRRKLTSILVVLIFCICFSPVANAVCDYETQVQLSTEANNVNANYEISEVVVNVDTGEEVFGVSEEEVWDDYNPYMYKNKVTISIYNITENIKVRITGDNGYEEEFTYQETDNGTITFDGGLMDNIVHYTISVLSTHPNCIDDELRTINLITPMENQYFYYSACEGVNEYFCQQFIDYDLNMTEGEVIERANAIRNNSQVTEEKEESEQNWWDNIREYLNNNSWIIYVTIGVIVVIAGVATTVIVIKKRRSKVL